MADFGPFDAAQFFDFAGYEGLQPATTRYGAVDHSDQRHFAGPDSSNENIHNLQPTAALYPSLQTMLYPEDRLLFALLMMMHMECSMITMAYRTYFSTLCGMTFCRHFLLIPARESTLQLSAHPRWVLICLSMIMIWTISHRRSKTRGVRRNLPYPKDTSGRSNSKSCHNKPMIHIITCVPVHGVLHKSCCILNLAA